MRRAVLTALLIAVALPVSVVVADDLMAALVASRRNAGDPLLTILEKYDGLYAAWDFNDPSDSLSAGGTINDRVGSSDLTIGATAIPTSNLNGRTTAVWNGSSTEARLAVSQWNSSATNGTLIVLLNSTGTAEYQAYFGSADEASATRYFLATRRRSTANNNTVFLANNDGATTTSSANNSMPDAQWTFVCTSFNNPDYPNTLVHHINGSISATTTSGAQRWFSSPQARDNITIGYYQSNAKAYYFGGQIALVAVYNKTLTTAQIGTLVNELKELYDL
jgi:hypothetical protein